jgi:hypothetical protein
VIDRVGLLKAAGIVGVALATGHVMQFGLPFAGQSDSSQAALAEPDSTQESRRYFAPRPRPIMPVLVGGAGSLSDALPDAPDEVAAAPALPRTQAYRRPVPDDPIRIPDDSARNNLNAFGIPCQSDLELTALEGGHVGLRLEATCNPNERVVIWHDGLRFADQTSALGVFEATVPAFRERAKFRVEFADGSSRAAEITAPDANEYDRVALQWVGGENLSIHAFEFGADRGDPGHVHRTRPSPVARLSGAVGGEIHRMGDTGLDAPVISEIYSFPSGHSPRSGVVRLMVEAEVTPFNCAKTVDAEAVQTEPEGGIRTVALALEMPGCEAVGDILVLKNVLRDLRIASN